MVFPIGNATLVPISLSNFEKAKGTCSKIDIGRPFTYSAMNDVLPAEGNSL